MTTRRRYAKQLTAPPWVKQFLVARVEAWEREPPPAGVNAEKRRKQISRIRALVTAAEMRAVWNGIEARCVESGFPSGEIAANALLGVAVYAIREPPTDREREVFHGGREAEIARQLRHLVSPQPFDSSAALDGHESCVLFPKWCTEALRIADYFEEEARKRGTWEPPPAERVRSTTDRRRFTYLISDELVRLFGDASPSWVETMTNTVFPEMPVDRKTVSEVSRVVRSRIPGD